jgi:hypothetical protein
MPETAKGRKIKSAMKKQYGAKKGESVFYASENAGTIKGVHKKKKKHSKTRRDHPEKMAKMYGSLDY